MRVLFVSAVVLNADMADAQNSENSKPAANDPAKAAFLAALEAKKSKNSGSKSQSVGNDKTDARKSGPDAARRMFQRRSGNS